MPRTNEPGAMAVDCPACDAKVVCQPKGHTFYDDPEEGPPERWTLVVCPKHHPLLVVQNEYAGIDFDDEDPYRMYPPQDRHLSVLIPRDLREAHDEARKCFHAKAFRATVVMSGRVLEGTCEKQGVKAPTLQKQLDKMRDKGLIDGRLAEWADTLRGVRNSAAHFNPESVTRQDAEDALAYSEALLDYLYVLKDRFESMRARRASEGG